LEELTMPTDLPGTVPFALQLLGSRLQKRVRTLISPSCGLAEIQETVRLAVCQELVALWTDRSGCASQTAMECGVTLESVFLLGVPMRFFKLVRSNVNVSPLLQEVLSNEQGWKFNESRQLKIQVQRDTNTIFIRGQVKRPDLNSNENQESVFTVASKLFPLAVGFLTDFARDMNAHLSRATIVRLKPKSQVFRHIDMGSYYFIRDRYHLVLYSSEGSVLISGDEHVRMKNGEVWWFNNKQFHEAHNESNEWRIHYIFDLLPRAYEHLASNALAV
jgi:Aspartyl/Asparaginyl beta-hydroxylase